MRLYVCRDVRRYCVKGVAMISKNEFLKRQNDILTLLESSTAALAASLAEFCSLNQAAEDAAAARKNAGQDAVLVLQGMFTSYEEAEEARDYVAALWVLPNLPESQRAVLAQPAPGRRDKSESANALRKARKQAQDKVSQYSGRLIDRAFPAPKLTDSEKVRAAVEKVQSLLEGMAKNNKSSDFDLALALDASLALVARVGIIRSIDQII